MHFEKGYIYHIYNQGNNRKKIFFGRENYLFFLRKMDTYIKPYADIFAYCLMPNHFHFMVLVKEVELFMGAIQAGGSRARTSIHTMTSSHRMNTRSLNDSIAIMLRSYTRAINKQQNRNGSLFKAHTKAECVNCPKGLTPSFVLKEGICQVNIQDPVHQYPAVCFNYIHQNPVKARLTKKAVDWEYSSARDYANLRKGKLINLIRAREYGFGSSNSTY
jgi:putative transposase